LSDQRTQPSLTQGKSFKHYPGIGPSTNQAPPGPCSETLKFPLKMGTACRLFDFFGLKITRCIKDKDLQLVLVPSEQNKQEFFFIQDKRR
jgi:hypothetical protein